DQDKPGGQDHVDRAAEGEIQLASQPVARRTEQVARRLPPGSARLVAEKGDRRHQAPKENGQRQEVDARSLLFRTLVGSFVGHGQATLMKCRQSGRHPRRAFQRILRPGGHVRRVYLAWIQTKRLREPSKISSGARIGTILTMLHIALYEPEIPPNTGNIARLCAATGTALHLIGRLGFRLDSRSLRRAGLDYWDAVEMHRHASHIDFEKACQAMGPIFAFSADGEPTYTQVNSAEADCWLFGGETSGLPPEMLTRFTADGRALTIPMPGGKVRSLNLATATGIALYEALRQLRRW